ncbi:major facilitator superfamily domain-containing protein [Melanogaster broomeanus]|nr:major facilitator superfamily domain-containing protein [Melanogaster broomeanus]
MLITSSDTRDDDHSVLLSSDGRDKRPTPLPKLQMSVLMLAILVEPIASQCIYPFINQLVGELNITGGDEKKVGEYPLLLIILNLPDSDLAGYYAGMIESLFFATQAMTILQWSRLSDRIGRKPVLLLGIFGLSLSMLCFGLSRSFTGLVLSRCITGALNGNIGVMKSMLGELTDSTNMAQGFALIPIAWSLGVSLGPVIGGTLSRPQDHFPRLFDSPFWAEFPYFLPCGVAAAFAVLTFVAILFFLKETLPPGVVPEKLASIVERDHEVGYGSVDIQHGSSVATSDAPVPLRELLNASRVLRIANYGMLATLEVVLYALQPLFYSTPIEYGGLGFEPMTIGAWMAVFGVSDGLIQAFCFAPLVERIGPKKLFRIGYMCFFPIFGLFPVISWVATRWGINWLIWVLLTCQLILTVIMDMAFSCILMYITAAAPNRRSLGALNGLAQTTASIARAIGPASATSLFAYSIQHNVVGGYGVYVVIVLLAFAALPLSAKLPDDMDMADS